MSKFGISRLDLVSGHALHFDIDEEVENGLFGEVDYATGKIAVTTDPSKYQHYISSVTNLYDSLDEGDFINKPKGMKVRALTLPIGDIVTTTKFTGKDHSEIKKGDYASADVGGKTKVSADAPEGVAQVFRVVEATYLNGQPAVAIQVEAAQGSTP